MPSAMAMATTAMPMGTKAATMAANTITRTMSATAMPIVSPLRASSSAILAKSTLSVDCPASCVVKPADEDPASTSRMPSIVAESSALIAIGMRVAVLSCETSVAACSGACATTS